MKCYRGYLWHHPPGVSPGAEEASKMAKGKNRGHRPESVARWQRSSLDPIGSPRKMNRRGTTFGGRQVRQCSIQACFWNCVYSVNLKEKGRNICFFRGTMTGRCQFRSFTNVPTVQLAIVGMPNAEPCHKCVALVPRICVNSQIFCAIKNTCATYLGHFVGPLLKL